MLGALALTFGACDGADSLDPSTSTPPNSIDETSTADSAIPDEGTTALDGPSLATSFAGGIPVGIFGLPTSQLGSRYNGVLRILMAWQIRSELGAIKSRGGKIVINLAGSPNYYKNADGTFSLSKWKARVDRYKNIDFNSYITDGTIIGHYLIDEPQDKSNWNGTQVSQATVEAMAKYSKQYWPKMPTLVRSSPDYMAAWSGTYQYLDGAWAQYLIRRWPDVDAYISKAVSKAKSKGLALVVGLNIVRGSPTGGYMTGSQIKTYGGKLLSDSYPCAFLSWTYRDSYLSQSSIKDAMSYLRSKAQNRPTKSCRGA